MQLKPLQIDDLTSVKAIYDYYILNSTATFHTETISLAELQEMIPLENPKYPSYGLYENTILIGFAYLAPFRKRAAYDISAEITLYFKPEYCQKGYGAQVVKQLEQEAKQLGIKNLMATICIENTNSIILFKDQGYTACACYKNIGKKFDRTLDVFVYQKEI